MFNASTILLYLHGFIYIIVYIQTASRNYIKIIFDSSLS